MKILVVDDMAVFREPIAASLRLAGYETICAADGEEALRIARAQHPDLILLDASMPKMDGFTCLKHLRADPSTAKIAVILLTALSEKKFIVAAASLGVKDYMLKSRFGLKDLIERIKKLGLPHSSAQVRAAAPTEAAAEVAAAAPAQGSATANSPVIAESSSAVGIAPPSEVKPLLTRELFLQRVEGVLQTKTLSGVVTQVLAMANSPRGDMAQLASLISRDPMLSARVIQAANSAAYASAGKVSTTITDAIRKVGYSAVRNIAAALGVFDCMPEAGADGFDPIRCWQHAFAVAQLCERFSAAISPENAGLAYVIGLCHDLGDIFIHTQFAKEYHQFNDIVASTGRPREQLHYEMLGMTRAQMMGAVFKCMGLPDAIREPIEIHHSVNGSRPSNPMARVLWMAENYANAAMIASSPSAEIAPFTQSFCRTAAGNPNPDRPDPQALRSEVLSLTVTLARVSRAAEAKLLVPMFKTSTAKVWLARESTVSNLDPIATALQSLAETSINKRLPTDRELADIDALVVIAPTSNTPGFSQAEIEHALTSLRRVGQIMPTMTFVTEPARADQSAAGDAARSMIALSELASFIEAASQRSPGAAAA